MCSSVQTPQLKRLKIHVMWHLGIWVSGGPGSAGGNHQIPPSQRAFLKLVIPLFHYTEFLAKSVGMKNKLSNLLCHPRGIKPIIWIPDKKGCASSCGHTAAAAQPSSHQLAPGTPHENMPGKSSKESCCLTSEGPGRG